MFSSRALFVAIIAMCLFAVGHEPPPPPSRLSVATGDTALGEIGTFSGGQGTCKVSAVPAKGTAGDEKLLYRIEYNAPRGSRPGWYLRFDPPINLSSYESIEFWVWCRPGTHTDIGLKDSDRNDDEMADLVELPRLGNRWQKVSVALTQFQKTNLQSVSSIVLQFASGTNGTIYVDSLACDAKPVTGIAVTPPPPPPFPVRITSPKHRGRVARENAVSGDSNLTSGTRIIPYVVPDGDGIAYEQSAGFVGDDGQWTAYCLFGREGNIDRGEWFTLYVVAAGESGRTVRSQSIRVQRE